MSNPIDNLLPSSDIFTSAFLVGNIGAPFVIGLAVGYFAKKMLRTALFLAGAIIVVLFVSEYYGIASVSDLQLQNAASAATNVAKSSGEILISRLSHITAKGVSAVGGFYFGFKMG
jgi:uncharacterized membrane protein (Fun14 family)